MSVARAIAGAAEALNDTSDTPRLDAELLMAHALGVSRETLLLRPPGDAVPAVFDALVARRRAYEPIAYLTGTRDFWTIELVVGPGVLIPRPDSETLIEAAVAHFDGRAPRWVLDLGTGSGALLLAALAQWPSAIGVGVDISAAALTIARANAGRLGMADRTTIVHGSWDAAADGTYDLVLCNPPYIGTDEALPPDVREYEPPSALFAGEEGLDDYRRIAPLLNLPPDGVACIEIGATQANAVCALFNAQGFSTSIRTDLSGHDRCILVTRGA